MKTSNARGGNRRQNGDKPQNFFRQPTPPELFPSLASKLQSSVLLNEFSFDTTEFISNYSRKQKRKAESYAEHIDGLETKSTPYAVGEISRELVLRSKNLPTFLKQRPLKVGQLNKFDTLTSILSSSNTETMNSMLGMGKMMKQFFPRELHSVLQSKRKKRVSSKIQRKRKAGEQHALHEEDSDESKDADIEEDDLSDHVLGDRKEGGRVVLDSDSDHAGNENDDAAERQKKDQDVDDLIQDAAGIEKDFGDGDYGVNHYESDLDQLSDAQDNEAVL